MKTAHKVERPRERMRSMGASALRDEELLALLLGTGTAGKDVRAVARGLLESYPGDRLLAASFSDLNSKKGIGPAKAGIILAAFELTRRLLGHGQNHNPAIQTPKDALPHLRDIRERKKEHFVALYLNARNQILHREFVSIGTLNSSLVHPREVFAPALHYSAAAVILAHNHPSGDCSPSREDVELTKRLISSGKLLGIEVLDHLVVSGEGYCSLKEGGHL